MNVPDERPTELCKAPAGAYDGVEGGRPRCPVPCPHENLGTHPVETAVVQRRRFHTRINHHH